MAQWPVRALIPVRYSILEADVWSIRIRDDILDREMLSLLAKKSQRGLPYQSFICNDDSRPHVMFTFSHNVKGDDDDRLLRGELLAMLATMKTRLSSSRLKDHLVVPVSNPHIVPRPSIGLFMSRS
jgi:hypothetical protein